MTSGTGYEPPLDDVDERAIVAALTREVLEEVAPEQVDDYDADPGRYLDGRALPPPARRPRPARSDEMTGFGVELTVALLAPSIAAGVAAAVRFVAGELAAAAREEAHSVIARWVRHLLHGPRAPLAEAPAAMPQVSPELLRRARDVTFATCTDRGVDAQSAALVADAVAGHLALGA